MSHELQADVEAAHRGSPGFAATTAYVFASAFFAATALAYVPNPIVGPDALFVTNGAHNMVHLLTAIAFVAVAIAGERASIRFMLGFGAVYCLVGLLGFVMLGSAGEGHLLGLVHINTMDNFLHVGLGLSILIAGIVSRQRATKPVIR